jgi:hypothetical protein
MRAVGMNRNLYEREHPKLFGPLVIDGVFAQDGERLRFRTARRLTRDDVAEVVAVVAHPGAACSVACGRRRLGRLGMVGYGGCVSGRGRRK